MASEVKQLSKPSSFKEQENAYQFIRNKEGRLYPDEIVKILPYVDDQHPLIWEWKVRRSSFEKLKHYLAAKNRSLQILDLGCGNGWMANGLSQINSSQVKAVDLNQVELEQGARVFNNNKNIEFIYGNIFEDILSPGSFDVIVVASAMQYFKDLDLFLKRLLALLRPGGEIHILDSPVYKEHEVEQAKLRSRKYYEDMGAGENFYYHHTWNEFKNFSYKVMNRSILDVLKLKLLKLGHLRFPWIVVSAKTE